MAEYIKKDISAFSEQDHRNEWITNYCNSANPIRTFDGILVKFYPDMFEHAFFESQNRMARDKSILSIKRCRCMHWIKEALQDPNAILKIGWDRDSRTYDKGRRLALVCTNYVVIIRMIREGTAKFVTAYEVDQPENLKLILSSPNWTKK